MRAVGTGDALKSAAIHPSVSGEVIKVSFKADQRVKKGAVLVRLDDEHQRLAVRLTRVALRKAKRDVARLEKLASSGHASRTRLDTVQTELESASVRLAQARADLADRTIVAPFSGVIGLTEIGIGDRITDDTMIATLDDRSIARGLRFPRPDRRRGHGAALDHARAPARWHRFRHGQPDRADFAFAPHTSQDTQPRRHDPSRDIV